MWSNWNVAVPLEGFQSSFHFRHKPNKHPGYKHAERNRGIETQGENSTPQNYCEAAKHATIPAEFLCSPFRLSELNIYMLCPDTRKMFFNAPIQCEITSLLQLQAYVYDREYDLNVKWSQKCRCDIRSSINYCFNSWENISAAKPVWATVCVQV